MPSRILPLLLFNLFVLSASAQRIPRAKMEVEADKTSGFTGEIYTLNIEVSGEGIESISWELIDNLFAEDILLKKSTPKASRTPENTFKREIIFTSADSGKTAIGPFPVIVRYLHETDTIIAQEVNFYFKQRPLLKSINEIMPVSAGGSMLRSNLFRSIGAVVFLVICTIGVVIIRRRMPQADSIQFARKEAIKGLELVAGHRAENVSTTRDSQEAATRIFKGYLSYVHAEKASLRDFQESSVSPDVLSPDEEWLRRLLKNDDAARYGIREQDDSSFLKHVQELKEFITLYPRADIHLKTGK